MLILYKWYKNYGSPFIQSVLNWLTLFLAHLYMILVKTVSPREGNHMTPRRTHDSNVQDLSVQLISNQLPHHPDMRHNLTSCLSKLYWESFEALVLKLKSPNILLKRFHLAGLLLFYLPVEFEPLTVAIQFGSFRKLENEDLAAKLRKWKFSGDQPPGSLILLVYRRLNQ